MVRIFLLYFYVIFISSLWASDTAHVKFYGKLLRSPADGSQLVTVLGDKALLTIVGEEGAWFEVQGEGFRGWIKKDQTSFVNKLSESIPSALPKDHEMVGGNRSFMMLTLGMSAVIVLSIFSMILLGFFIRKNKRKGLSVLRSDVTIETEAIDHQSGSRYHVIVFSEKDKNVKSSVSNIHKRLSTCFREIGFNVSFTGCIKNNSVDVPFKIDLVAVDYNLEKKAVRSVEELVEKRIFPPDIPVLFYNIKAPSSVDPSMKLKKTYYMGESFNEQDLMKIASEVVNKNDKKNRVMLQGKVTGDGIYEILQLVEVGRKTGVMKLMSSSDCPIGVMGFQGGAIIFARTSRQSGREAALELLGVKTGFFHFSVGNMPENNCYLNPQELMMNAAKREDEGILYQTSYNSREDRGHEQFNTVN